MTEATKRFAVTFAVSGMGSASETYMELEGLYYDVQDATDTFQEWLDMSPTQTVFDRLPGSRRLVPRTFKIAAVNGFTIWELN